MSQKTAIFDFTYLHHPFTVHMAQIHDLPIQLPAFLAEGLSHHLVDRLEKYRSTLNSCGISKSYIDVVVR
jgi:hypothetical protein